MTQYGLVMVKKTVEKIYSDLSGVELDGDGRTLTFAVDGTSYELDATAAEAEDFHAALAPYVAAARQVYSARRKATTPVGKADPKAVRAWAVEQGIDVPSRGRVPATVVDAYLAFPR